ncbi:MAG TPA: fused MFS/spermidine synthase [Thermoanaerobaculia bacterium]|nr:fused MFS/spermidine synthase [Thermoanaerobaculia bacterium]
MTKTWRAAGLLFGSGMAALVYQTVWFREFRMIFGGSTSATAAVLAIFMGGLGLGSALIGKRADAHPTPLAFYGTLELIIAATAIASLPLLSLVRAVYVAAGGSTVLGEFVATIVRLILATVILAIPTVCMGGTLPAAARAVESESDQGRGRLAILYGVNTLGAVTGTLLSTFLMLEVFGNRRTLILAALLNFAVGLTARSIGRKTLETQRPKDEALEAESATAVSRNLIFAAAAIAGFAFLLMELVWYRMLSPILGGTTFMFGLILAIALLGIGSGGVLYAVWNRASAGALALTTALEAAAICIPFALGDRVAMAANLLRPLGNIGFSGHLLSWTIITLIVVFPAALIAGVQFPILIALLGRGRENVGRDVGLAYAWNTFGAILGSLAGGFGLLPFLSATGAWRLVVAMLAILAAVLLLVAIRGRGGVLRNAAAAGAIALSVAGLFSIGPTGAWRHAGIGAGRAPMPETRNSAREMMNVFRQNILREADGRESSIAVMSFDDLGLLVNGKSDGSARGDAGTQVMGGLIGAILHPRPQSALVVGLGTGSTAGWLGRVPSIERVDCIELEPEVIRAAREFDDVNGGVFANPKVHVTSGDGRELLMTTKRRYDIIFSQPSNPYRAGVASLFTRDYYQSAAERLQPGGVFLQWMQAYEIGAATLRTIYATSASVFPSIETYLTKGGDLLLVASRQPITYDFDRLRSRVREEPFRTALHQSWRVESLEGFLSHYVGNQKVTEALRSAGDPLNTDDRTVVEFGFARHLGRREEPNSLALQGFAAARGWRRPLHSRGAVDWQLVDMNRGGVLALTPERGSEDFARRRAFAESYEAEDLPGALSAWRRGPFAITTTMEAAALGEVLADSGDERALQIAEKLRPYQPAESDAIAARLRVRQGREEDAAALLEQAFTRLRSDAWPSAAIVERAIGSAVEISRSPAIAHRMYAALSQRFAAGQANLSRLTALTHIGYNADHCGAKTVAALRALEPNPPWNRRHLQMRSECYAKASLSELASRAAGDLAEFVAAEPDPLISPHQAVR